MECLPGAFKEKPRPVIILLGGDITNSYLKKILEDVNATNPNTTVCSYLHLTIEHQFPDMTSSSLSQMEEKGILETKWLRKVHDLIPAVVLSIFQMDIHDASSWEIQETVICTEMDRLRRVLKGRDCRIVLVLMLQRDGESGIPEERLSSLRKKAEVESKAIWILQPSDLSCYAAQMIKLEVSVRSLAVDYYKGQAKVVKKKINRTTPTVLQVRYSFQIAHYYEFREQPVKMLKHYNAAYKSLIATPFPTQESDVITLGQMKTVAGLLTFKIAYHELFSMQNVQNAVAHFQLHMKVFGRAVGPEAAYHHWSWVSSQYQLFAEMLTKCTTTAHTSIGLESTQYREPYYYYSIAAKYAMWRRKAAAKLGVSATASNARTDEILKFKDSDFSVRPAPFWGEAPYVKLLSDRTVLPQPSAEALLQYQTMKEFKVAHEQVVITLLELALNCLKNSTFSRFSRFSSHLIYQKGIEFQSAGQFQIARTLLESVLGIYIQDTLWAVVTPLLKRLLLCVVHEGDIRSCLETSLQLLSPQLSLYLEKEERLSIQARFMEFLLKTDSSELSFKIDKSKQVMHATIHFNTPVAVITETVTMTLTMESFFPNSILFSELRLICNDARYNKVIRHATKDVSTPTRLHDITYNLEFVPHSRKQICIDIDILCGKDMIVKCHEIELVFSDSSTSITIPVVSAHIAPRQVCLSTGNCLPPNSVQIPDHLVVENADNHYVTILQPPPKTTMSVVAPDEILVDSFHKIAVTIRVGEEKLRDAGLELHCHCTDDVNLTAPFFYHYTTDGQLVCLDQETYGKPSQRPLEEIETNSSYTLLFYVQCIQTVTCRLQLVLTYTAPQGYQVLLEEMVTVSCITPFTSQFDCIPSYPLTRFPLQYEQTSTVELPVQKPVFIEAQLFSCSTIPVHIEELFFEPATEINVDDVVVGGSHSFSDEKSEKLILCYKDEQRLHVRVPPMTHSCSLSVGTLRVRWRTIIVQNDNEETLPSILPCVLTEFRIPEINFVYEPVSIELTLPDYGIVGKPILLCLHLRNNTTELQPFKISINKTCNFMIHGLLQSTEYAQPNTTTTSHFTLIPLSSGCITLPILEVVSLRSNTSLIPPSSCKTIFVAPGAVF